MILAHGTSAKWLKDIEANGLKPRGEKKSGWKRAPSAADRVYLSNAYAFYFAEAAAIGTNDLLIVEVDVDEKNLYPDEDFLGFATKENEIGKNIPDLVERTLFMRDWIVEQPFKVRKDLTQKSLEFMGNAAYRGTITPDRITRMALIPNAEVGRIILQEFDPIISPINYRFMGEQYREFQKSLFDRYPLEAKNI